MVYILFAITVQLPQKNGGRGGIRTRDPDHEYRYQIDALDHSVMIPHLISPKHSSLMVNRLDSKSKGPKFQSPQVFNCMC